MWLTGVLTAVPLLPRPFRITVRQAPIILRLENRCCTLPHVSLDPYISTRLDAFILNCDMTFRCLGVLHEATCMLCPSRSFNMAGFAYLVEVRVVMFMGPLIMMILLLLHMTVTLRYIGLGLRCLLVTLNLMALLHSSAFDPVTV